MTSNLPELPEPIAYLDQHRAKRLGQKIPMMTTLTVHQAFPDDVMLFTADQLREYATKVRDEADRAGYLRGLEAASAAAWKAAPSDESACEISEAIEKLKEAP